MKYVLIALFAIVISIEIAFPVRAISMPPVDEIEMMMAKIQDNLRMASEVTHMAQSKSAALVAQKQQEKADLKEAVVAAEQKSEMFAAKMIANGIDTTTVEVPMTGPAYDAYINYIEEGGKDDFDYFRMYLWQQK
jgi:hypothetical protein